MKNGQNLLVGAIIIAGSAIALKHYYPQAFNFIAPAPIGNLVKVTKPTTHPPGKAVTIRQNKTELEPCPYENKNRGHDQYNSGSIGYNEFNNELDWISKDDISWDDNYR